MEGEIVKEMSKHLLNKPPAAAAGQRFHLPVNYRDLLIKIRYLNGSISDTRTNYSRGKLDENTLP